MKKVAGSPAGESNKQAGNVQVPGFQGQAENVKVRGSQDQAGNVQVPVLQVSFLNDKFQTNLQPSSGCKVVQNGTQGGGEDVPFSGLPLSLQGTAQHPGLSHLHVVPDTSSQLVAPAAEVLVHAPPAGVLPTGRSGFRPGVVSGPCSHVVPSTVGGPRT